MLNIVDHQVFGLAAAEEIVATCGVLQAFDILSAFVIISRYLAEVTPTALDLGVDNTHQVACLNIPDVNLAFHRSCGALLLVRVDRNSCDLRTVFQSLDIELPGKHFMHLQRLIPRAGDQPFPCHLDTRYGR